MDIGSAGTGVNGTEASAFVGTPEPAGPDDTAPSPATFREVVPDAEPDAPAAFTPVADDLLPRPKGRKGRD